MAWIAQVAIAAYGAYQTQKARKEGSSESSERYRTPYMNEYLSKFAPYLMSAAQQLYQTRSKNWGIDPPDFGPTGAQMGGISPDYSGVGKPGQFSSGATGNPFSSYLPKPEPKAPVKPPEGGVERPEPYTFRTLRHGDSRGVKR